MEARIYNDGHFDWKEEYKGQIIEIPKGGYITMQRSRAVKFLSQFAPFKREGGLKELNKKQLRMVVDPEEFAAHTDQPLKYQAKDGTRFRTKQGVINYEEDLVQSNRGTAGGRKKASS